MKLAIFGATGGAGRPLVQLALDAGHDVTAIVRDPAAVTTRHDRLRVVKADVQDADAVAAALVGQDAVISTIGPRPGTPAGTLISTATRNILAGMKPAGVGRFVLTSGLMVGAARGMSWWRRLPLPLFRLLNRSLMRDKVLAEHLVRGGDAAWVIVRPPLFGAVPERKTFRTGVDLDVKLTKMANADVARALLAAVADDTLTAKAVEISY